MLSLWLAKVQVYILFRIYTFLLYLSFFFLAWSLQGHCSCSQSMILLISLNPTHILFTSFLCLCISPISSCSLICTLFPPSYFYYILFFSFFLQEPCGICHPMNRWRWWSSTTACRPWPTRSSSRTPAGSTSPTRTRSPAMPSGPPSSRTRPAVSGHSSVRHMLRHQTRVLFWNRFEKSHISEVLQLNGGSQLADWFGSRSGWMTLLQKCSCTSRQSFRFTEIPLVFGDRCCIHGTKDQRIYDVADVVCLREDHWL